MKITKIHLNKTQTAFISKPGSNGVVVISGTVETIAALFAQYDAAGCEIVFDTYAAPNFKRCFNAYLKRAKAIASAAGIQITEPAEYFIDGHRQADKFVMTVQA
jgi:hypothetical protein